MALLIDRNKRRYVMLNTPMSRLIPKMAIPTIISMLVTSLYNLADTYFVSSLGTTATAAVGINFSLDMLIMTIGGLLGVGANSFIARLLGAKQDQKASQVLATSFFSAIFISLILAITGLIAIEPLVRLLGATDNIIRYSMDYAGFVLYAAAFTSSSFVLNHSLRSEGSAIYSMIGIVSGAVLNIALDPLFIIGLGWGVKGAGAATAISKTVSFFVLLLPYLRRSSILNLSIRNIHYSREIVTEVLKMGFPSFLRMILMSTAIVIMNKAAGLYSDSVLAGMSVVNRVVMFPTAALLGFAQGYQPVSGFNWGAKRYDRVLQAFWFASFWGAGASVLMGLGLGLFATPIMHLFTQTDQEMIAIGVLSIRLQSIVFPVHAWVIVVNICYASLGKARGAALLSLARQGLCYIPMILILPLLMAAQGLAAAQAAADILSFAMALPLCILLVRDIRRRQAQVELEAGSEKDVVSA